MKAHWETQHPEKGNVIRFKNLIEYPSHTGLQGVWSLSQDSGHPEDTLDRVSTNFRAHTIFSQTLTDRGTHLHTTDNLEPASLQACLWIEGGNQSILRKHTKAQDKHADSARLGNKVLGKHDNHQATTIAPGNLLHVYRYPTKPQIKNTVFSRLVFERFFSSSSLI